MKGRVQKMAGDQKLSKNEYIKQRTQELYDMLPQEESERKKHVEIRDEIISLNMAFFGYVASHTFINNPSVTYEDKFQSALTHFLECWWWYKWKGHYRTDLSFSVFYKPRIGEMIERELNEVKYSVRRSLCMEAGKQLGKHWGQVRYEDLSQVKLPADKMNALKAIFGTLYWADLEEHSMFIESPGQIKSEFAQLSDNYDSIEDLLIREMVDEEKPLTDKDLKHMAEMYGIEYIVLKDKYPIALEILYKRLHNSLDNMIE